MSDERTTSTESHISLLNSTGLESIASTRCERITKKAELGIKLDNLTDFHSSSTLISSIKNSVAA